MNVKMLYGPNIVAGEPNPGRDEVYPILYEGISTGWKNQLRTIAVIDIHSPVAAVDVGRVPVRTDGYNIAI
jgi:hypothetical protein